MSVFLEKKKNNTQKKHILFRGVEVVDYIWLSQYLEWDIKIKRCLCFSCSSLFRVFPQLMQIGTNCRFYRVNFVTFHCSNLHNFTKITQNLPKPALMTFAKNLKVVVSIFKYRYLNNKCTFSTIFYFSCSVTLKEVVFLSILE